MNAPIKLNFFFFFVLIINEGCFAQFISSESEESPNHHFFISTGLEPVWVSTVGYTHKIGEVNKKVDVHLGGSIKLAPLIAPINAWRTNFITAADWDMKGFWRTSVISEVYLAHQENRSGTINGIGIEIRAIPLNYAKKWAKGVDMGWQFTALTHIRHSFAAKDTFNERYPQNTNGINNPKDGWYGATSNRFRLGFATTRNLGKRLLISVTAGMLINIQNQGILMSFSHAQFPFYFQSGLVYRW